MSRIAVFPGSFDPITLGHTSIINRALPLFDQIIVAIGVNSEKKYMFNLEKRQAWIEELFQSEPKIKVENYSGLTVDFCQRKQAGFLLRGLRNQQDFEFERTIAQMNRQLNDQVETVFLFTEPKFSAIQSSIVRDILRNGGNVKHFVPDNIQF